MSYRNQLNDSADANPAHTRKVMRDIIPPGQPLKLTKKQSSVPGEVPAENTPAFPVRISQPRAVEKPEASEQLHKVATQPESSAKVDETSPIAEDLPIIRTWEPSHGRRKQLIRRISTVSSIVALVGVVVIPTFIFPKFSIVIHPKVEQYAIGKLELIADTTLTNSDVKNRKIPAVVITTEKELSQDFEATGKKFIEAKARGTVTIVNAFNSSPQGLVVNTRLEDSTGKIFRLLSAITVPGAKVESGKVQSSSITAAVIADKAGDTYNIGPSSFHIPGFRGTPKYEAFTATSETAFTGGQIGEAKVATSDDVKNASEALTKRMIESLRGELDKKIPADPDFISPAGGRETSIVNIISPKAGDPGDKFTVTVSGKGRLIAVRMSDLSQTLASILIPPDEATPIKTPRTQNGIITAVTTFEPGKPQTHLSVSGTVNYYRESSTGDIRSVLRTSTPKKAEAYLRGKNEIDSFRLKRFPPWLWFIPAREKGLAITIETPA